MASEAHKAQVVGGTTEDEKSGNVLWYLHEFITNEAAAILRIVDDGTSATWDGSAFGTPGAASFFQTAGAYLVVEPIAGGSWQAKIRYDGSTTDDLEIELSDQGGWQNSDGTFGANNTSGLVRWNDSAAPSASDTMYMSACDLDGYTYLRCFIYDGTVDQNAFYAGGYIALDPADTDPVCCLVRRPEIANRSSSNTWGHASAGQGYTPNEYGGSSTPWTVANASIDTVRAATYSNDGKTRNSIFALFPVFVFTSDSFVHGYFGEYTMYGVDGAKADLDVDNAGAYIVTNDLAHRWNP